MDTSHPVDTWPVSMIQMVQKGLLINELLFGLAHGNKIELLPHFNH